MSEERRRVSDTRIDKIESLVMDLHAKVNNGLTERSKSTQQKVDELHSQSVELQKEYIKHSAQSAAHLQQNSKAIEEFSTIAKGILKTQGKWESRVAYATWAAGAGAVLVSAWVVNHIAPIAEILAPLLGS